ncbi:hypothetical protein SCATT_28430 [Streptantibioticus cattleyicolor NRRL 8057 = DSM 46488]|uniref:Esterase n=1 Tax=Streptantibioticus cattleyicolor (strain ATCC 35852 / DSM 46488 / JCM 4925 / NBRC 14057 / NRRL 8057) TaxID=1003195 RepID=F8JP67_STREN|nr:hypothetical protein [Streptomyces sp. SID5468]AEW95214.1 hypothetical protein SCATT_28430 [Streptantibioticus cattleyicolor NRRL 8057 = DSM 46488]MYS59795.1 hypothetical protein [Streptomyces sp. SID5468]CCB75559.1 exported protein of unknown function [Streptantibioticus cattleyicolor NRRL 8057 = DSM 46488]
MAAWVFGAVVLAVGVGGTVLLARAAAVRWAAERAGRTYELPVNYRAAVVRTAGAVLALTGAVAVALNLPYGRATQPRTVMAAAPHPAPPAGRPAARPARPSAPREVARPAGGSLAELADGTRVWLPPQYAGPNARKVAFPLVVAYLPATAPEREELYPAFVRHTARGLADPFVVVVPRDCGADPVAAMDEAARRYRVVAGRDARAVLGVGPYAPCALRAALAHPDRYRAAVGVSGTYDGGGAVTVPTGPVPPGGRPHVLLTTAATEQRQRSAAMRLLTALRRIGARVRFLDHVLPQPGAGSARRRQLALVSGYLTEEFAAPKGPGGRVRPAPPVRRVPVRRPPSAGRDPVRRPAVAAHPLDRKPPHPPKPPVPVKPPARPKAPAAPKPPKPPKAAKPARPVKPPKAPKPAHRPVARPPEPDEDTTG